MTSSNRFPNRFLNPFSAMYWRQIIRASEGVTLSALIHRDPPSRDFTKRGRFPGPNPWEEAMAFTSGGMLSQVEPESQETDDPSIRTSWKTCFTASKVSAGSWGAFFANAKSMAAACASYLALAFAPSSVRPA